MLVARELMVLMVLMELMGLTGVGSQRQPTNQIINKIK